MFFAEGVLVRPSARFFPPLPVKPSLTQKAIAEVIGTFLLVFFGCGSVHTAVLYGAQNGVWQVAVVWGIAIMLAAYTVGGVSGAHLNPAMTIALAVYRRFDWPSAPAYIAAQLFGAFLAAGVLFCLFSGKIREIEHSASLLRRGDPGSIVTASCYGEYFPNPGGLKDEIARSGQTEWEQIQPRVTLFHALLAEMLGTAILSGVVFAVTDQRNTGAPPAGNAPIFIGLTVAALISVLAPLTQACFNPARDLGPRALAYLVGWGSVAIPGPNGWSFLIVYLFAPIAGAILGGARYERVLRPALPNTGDQ